MSLDLDAKMSDLLTHTAWHPVGIEALRSNYRSTSSAIDRTISVNAKRFGYEPEQLPVERSHSSNTENADEKSIDSSPYGAGDLNRLIADVGASRLTLARAALDEWFDRNVEAGQGINVLRSLEEHRNSESWLSPVAALFDKAFDLSRKLQGKNIAYKWLVAAHACRQGWERFHDEEIQVRFGNVARYYADRWRDFVHATSKSPYRSSPGLVIPSTRLVELMVEVGDFDAAILVTRAMVDSVVESFSDQPLRKPVWLSTESTHA
jgi:hypothetical protein